MISQSTGTPPRPYDLDASGRNWADFTGLSDTLAPALAPVVKGARGNPNFAPWLDAIFGSSPFLSSIALARPELVVAIAQEGCDQALALALEELRQHECADIALLMPVMRRAKAGAAFVIAVADITHAWPLMQVTGALTDLADLTVQKTVRALLRQGAASGDLKLSNPDAPEENCGYFVLALGKHGGRELNYSSDIDLYVVFDEAVFPYVGRKSPQEYAVRMTRDFVRAMQERTPDGYVFRTDLRLRPDPSSTAIAVSRVAATAYYESYGQNWERAALIKARFIAGDGKVAAAFLKDLETFIWRKSLDFYAIEDIRSIKRQIYAHKGGATVKVPGHNIKLGRGGIREIEFFAQTQQLIWGGRYPDARSSQTFGALEVLTQRGIVKPEVREELVGAYTFLRRLEHRLQMINDEQTQTLPTEDTALLHIAAFMGYADVATFSKAVESVLTTVEAHYAALFEESPTLAIEGNLVFTGTEDDPDTLKTLQRLGFTNPSAVAASVRGWHTGKYRATRTLRARQLLTELIPILLKTFGATSEPDAAFARFDQCLAQLNAGVQLLSVLQANPKLLDLLAEIMGDAPRLAGRVTANPALLDAVVDPEFFARLKPLPELRDELTAAAAKTADFEDFLDTVRRWSNDHRFQAELQILRGLTGTSDGAGHLSDLAEVILGAVVPRVQAEFAVQNGRIPDSEFAVIAYGKLGSRELTPASDLDLVLVYSGDEAQSAVDGAKSLPASAYYIRLAQRIVTALTTLSGLGRLYEVDLRLRPNGDKGPLACSTHAFEKYMREDAWTWEHMALTRARVIVGGPAIKADIDRVIATTLNRPRDLDALMVAIADMRQRMRGEHQAEDLWDLKRRRGGLIDIEFIAQYCRLKHSAPADLAGQGIPGLLAFAASSGDITAEDARVLTEALGLLTRLQVLLRLTLPPDQTKPPFPEGLRKKLAALGGVADMAALEERLNSDAAAVGLIYDRVLDLPAATARKKFTEIPH